MRVGVIGGGLVAQAVHLPGLAALPDRFATAALAEPSATVRQALVRRHRIPAAFERWEDLLEQPLDAVIVCSPNGTHAEIVLAALAAGLHVLVEKPLCVTLADADAIVAARNRTGLVVQVGYMKRFDPRYRRLAADLAAAGGDLRLVEVTTYDPVLERHVAPGAIVRADDVDPALRDATRRALEEQVDAAIGTVAPEAVHGFVLTFLGALVHDVNLVHGLLDALRAGPATALAGSCWAGGRAGLGLAALPCGARWSTAWLELPGVGAWQEALSLYFADCVWSLSLPAPYSSVVTGARGRPADVFRAELEHFHDCVVAGAECLTPPEQARRDIRLLTDMFRLGGLGPGPSLRRRGTRRGP